MTHPIPAPRPPSATARRLVSLVLAIAASIAAILAAPAPAQASYPTCSATVRTSANHTYFSVTGNPQNPNRVYSFRVRAGAHTYTFIPTYRTYVVNRKMHWFHQVEAWVNGYKCRTWQGANLF